MTNGRRCFDRRGCSRGPCRKRGMTLLEVVIALMLFALMSMFLLSGHAHASDSILRAEIERDMAELIRLRLELLALEHEEYRSSTDGEFPADVSTRLLDERKVLGDRYAGYRWEVDFQEVVAAGAQGRVEMDGEGFSPLFPQEGGGTEAESEDEAGDEVQPDEVDRMLFIRVTVYPPGWDERPAADDEQRRGARPLSAWTAVLLPPEEDEESGIR